jgi:hypothetical protein
MCILKRLQARATLVFAALAVLAVLVATLAALTLSSGSTRADVILAGVAPDDLKDAGIELQQPADNDAPLISQADAETLAAKEKQGAKVQEVVLARLKGGIRPEETDIRLVWIVNFDPATVSGYPPLGSSSEEFHQKYAGMAVHPRFALSFVDAHTGDVLFNIEQSDDSGLYPAPTDSPTEAPNRDIP